MATSNLLAVPGIAISEGDKCLHIGFFVVLCYVARVLCDGLVTPFGKTLTRVSLSVLELSTPTNCHPNHELRWFTTERR